MLTTNYLQRSLFKWKLAVLLILIITAMITAISFSINRYLPKYALAYCNLLNQQLTAKISFSSIRYRFPNTLILKNVQVFEPNAKTPMLETPRMAMAFSLPISSSGPSLNYVVLKDMTVDFVALKNYWKQHSPSLYAWTRALPKENLRLLLSNGRLYLKGLTGQPISFTIDFSLKQNHVAAQGFWEDTQKFHYELYGDMVESGFNLSKLDVEGGQVSVNLWGRWQKDSIDWKGFILYKKFYILDINGHLNIQDRDLILKGLSFSVNGDDVAMAGHCSKQKLFQCGADMTFSRPKQHLSPQEPLKNMNLHLEAQNTTQGLFFTGHADLNFLLQNAHLDFQNLKAHLMNTDFLKLKIDHLSASWASPDKHKILIENLLASIHLAQSSQANIALSARMYAGNYHGRIFLDTTSLPWQIKGQGKFEGVDINRLSDTFSFLQQCHGIAWGSFNFQALKDIQLAGALRIHQGDFSDPHFLPWVAKTLQMPSVEHLSGADLYCHFKINGNSKMLEYLKLHTDDLDLNGFFHLDEEDLVSSRISVRFSQKLLNESPIGRNILGMVHEAWALPFEFRLSGNIYRMNFQWDHSPLKDKVRQHMFAFVERMIDRRIDANPYMVPQSPGL